MRTSIRYSLLLGLSLAMLLLSVTGSRAAAQEDGPVYIVQPGDTLTAIARTFGTSVDALVNANGLADASRIFPGQRLTIPGFPGVSGVLSTRSLSFGETLRSASLSQDVPERDLARLNRIVNPTHLVVGRDLIVPEPADEEVEAAGRLRAWAGPGQGLLELAARQGVNPWALQQQNRLPGRLWLLPRELLYLPGEEAPAKALPPAIGDLSLSPYPAMQGRTLVITIELLEAATLSGDFDQQRLNLMTTEAGSLVALQGIHALAEPVPTELVLELTAPDGELLDRFSQAILVIAGDYGFEQLIVPPETVDPKVTGPEDDLIKRVVSASSAERLWDGAFQYPTSYYETFRSLFGTRRSYNGSAYIYYHTGLDLPGSTQTPVLAPAPGVVVFAQDLTVRGNVTYIDHGWGVYTGYLHQSQILVQVGDFVQPGQIIGYVGGTGRATGSHLHWEVWVGGVPVDPREWTVRVFP